MDNTVGVRVREGRRETGVQREHAGQGDNAGGDLVAQRPSFEQLADHVPAAAIPAGVVHPEDVRMLEECGEPALAHEALAGRRVELTEHLQGDLPVEDHLAGAIDGAHAAFAEETEDLVARGQLRREVGEDLPGLVIHVTQEGTCPWSVKRNSSRARAASERTKTVTR